MSRFIADLATIARPIQVLMKKNTRFVWDWKQNVAFAKLKKANTHPDVLVHFKNDCKTRIVADAFSLILGAVLTQFQVFKNICGMRFRMHLACNRREKALQSNEKMRPWSLYGKRFNIYDFGKEFELQTDHRPLQHIYCRKSKPSE